MGFKEAITTVFNKYANFDGRARRSEYWYFALFNFLVAGVLSILGQNGGFFSTIASIYSLAVLVPGIAVCTRRLHDTGKSGWYQLMVLIPIVGYVILIIRLVKDTDPNPNQYGPSPKGYTEASYKEMY